MDLLRMEWRDVGFVHWPVDPSIIARTLPDQLTVDTYDGQAWLGVVPFRMTDIRPRGSPIGLSFTELNLRTYVRGGRGPGVYFYNLDADDPLGVTVARRFFELPYYEADMDVERGGETVRFQSQRTHEGVPPARFDATIETDGVPETPRSESLEAFLVERYRFYADSDEGTVYYAEIKHSPWPLQESEVTIRRNDLFAANGFDEPDSDRVVHYSPGIDVTAGRLRKL